MKQKIVGAHSLSCDRPVRSTHLQVVRRRADYEDYLSCKATEKQRPACYHLAKYEVLATTRVDELK